MKQILKSESFKQILFQLIIGFVSDMITIFELVSNQYWFQTHNNLEFKKHNFKSNKP
jgi:hypothetical protein